MSEGKVRIDETRIAPYFNMRGDVLVTVMLPTRGRAAQLKESVNSLLENAFRPDWIELLFWVDDDDQETQKVVAELMPVLPCRRTMFVFPRGNGYADMHLWVNRMAFHARGGWLYLWNDDARMLTKDWDKLLFCCYLDDADKILSGCPEVLALWTAIVDRPDEIAFMFVRRTVTEILGHYSLIPCTDYWLANVLRFMGRIFLLPSVVVSHPTDELRKCRDPLRLEVDAVANKISHVPNSYRSIKGRIKDVQKLLTFIEANRDG